MEFRNHEGTHVDPVPFLVAAAFGFLVVFSYGPPYLLTLGLPLPLALVVCGGITALLTAAAYHHYVWAYHPERASIVEPGERIKRLFYGALILVGVLALLALPLFVR
ncbi:hypothetical protein [Natronomonas sp. EA1]|uniref:hypothetical protein n=1 Tax=Natronomonas sp. EA1 TaxID=3421655 RepID=UPI003EBFF235